MLSTPPARRGQPKGCQVHASQTSPACLRQTEQWFSFGLDDVWTFFHSHCPSIFLCLGKSGERLIYWRAGSWLWPYLHLARSPERFLEAARQREGHGSQPDGRLRFRNPHRCRPTRRSGRRQTCRLRYVILRWRSARASDACAHGSKRPRRPQETQVGQYVRHNGNHRPRDIFGRSVGQMSSKGRGSVIGQTDSRPLEFIVPQRAASAGERWRSPAKFIVSGGGVCRGYLNRPEPHCRTLHRLGTGRGRAMPRGLYKTGDLAKNVCPDGDLEYLGRQRPSGENPRLSASRPAKSKALLAKPRRR